jgi:hypothetical protein
VFGVIVLVAFAFGCSLGRGEAMASAALEGAGRAIELTLTLGGAMCLWCGVMRVLEEAGAVGTLARLLRRPLAFFFPDAAADDAVAAAESWDPYNGVIGTITVNGVSFVGIDPQTGDCYFKVTIANGVLTMVNEMDDSVALTVVLSEAVLNGTESLTINFNFGYWAKVEVTEMHTVSYVENIK